MQCPTTRQAAALSITPRTSVSLTSSGSSTPGSSTSSPAHWTPWTALASGSTTVKTASCTCGRPQIMRRPQITHRPQIMHRPCPAWSAFNLKLLDLCRAPYCYVLCGVKCVDAESRARVLGTKHATMRFCRRPRPGWFRYGKLCRPAPPAFQVVNTTQHVWEIAALI